ncbi:MAG: arabinose-5-phosphate isomerase [Oligoflexia bacterium]|nr:MAG: arabinose-5-phosphate isomerase [Oligoflexia bacterium]
MKLKPVELAQKVFDVEAQAILALKDRVGDAFEKAVSIVVSCSGKVILTGIGKSGIIARKIASTMSSTGTPAIFLHPSESAHGDLGLVGKNDVVIAISYGGDTPELTPVLTNVNRRGLPLIAITGNASGELAQRAQVVLDVKVSKEACPLGLAPTASSTATLAMGDALAMAVLESKGFSTDEFALNHPGGGLGFKLSRIRDLMHTGKAMPILKMDTPMKQVLGHMSSGEVRGAAGIVDDQGDLIGIITDGDIRRKLESSQDPLSGTAGELMTKGPRTIDANELAEKALFMMEQFRINLLFVLDKNSSAPKRPVGLIHVQDLIKAKVR